MDENIVKTAWDIENKTDIIDNEIELLSFATEQESIICYGAGDYANRLLVFLRAHGVDIASFCVSVGMVKNDYFCGHELYNISEIDFTQKNIGVIVAANENLHPDMREELQRRDVEAVFLSSELMNRIEKDDRYATQILINEIAFYNNCNSKRGGAARFIQFPNT